MNIAYVHPHPEVRHGSELAMAREVEGVRAAGHRVFLLHGGASGNAAEVGYVASYSDPRMFAHGWKSAQEDWREMRRHARQFLERHQIDLIHLHALPKLSVWRDWVRTHPVVVTLHTPLCPSGGRYFYRTREVCQREVGLGCISTGYLEKRCACFVDGRRFGLASFALGIVKHHRLVHLLSLCSRLVAPSRAQKERLVRDDLPEPLIEVVHPTVTDESLPAAPVHDALPVVLFVGRLLEFKGADHLLRASALVDTPHQLWLAGDGPQRPALEALARQLNLSPAPVFHGALDGAALASLRQRAHVAAVPSLLFETFNMVGPEAMRHALPVVAYDVGGIRDWLQEGITGRLIPAGSITGLAAGLAEMLRDREKARAFGAAGRLAAAAFGPAEHTQKIMQVYRQALPTRATA